MTPRSLPRALAATAFALAASGCFRSETPTGPSLPASTSGVVHVVGQNASPGSLGLTSWSGGLYPASVEPGGSVEMMRWNVLVQGASFIVFEPIAEQPHFRAVATVGYNVVSVPTSARDEVSPVVRVSRDGSGAVTAVSDRPDVVEIVRVTTP